MSFSGIKDTLTITLIYLQVIYRVYLDVRNFNQGANQF